MENEDRKGVHSATGLGIQVERSQFTISFIREHWMIRITSKEKGPWWRLFRPVVLQVVKGNTLQETNLHHANLSNADLKGANLWKALLRRSKLQHADLSNANLSETDLSESKMPRADLSGANLKGANLERASLSGANLGKGNLLRTIFAGANLTLRPGGVLVGQRRFEVRAEDARQHPGEVRQVELQESVSMEATEPTACRVGNPRLVAATPYAGWL